MVSLTRHVDLWPLGDDAMKHNKSLLLAASRALATVGMWRDERISNRPDNGRQRFSPVFSAYHPSCLRLAFCRSVLRFLLGVGFLLPRRPNYVQSGCEVGGLHIDRILESRSTACRRLITFLPACQPLPEAK
jgi:hypothetical protein